MKGIVGKKLGMTQVFDPETGEVTPVTVIEAGPCPVVRVKTDGRRTATTPSSSRSTRWPSASSRSRGSGTSEEQRRPAPAPRRVPRHERAHARRDRHRRGLRAGRQHQGHRDRDRQGLRRHDQAAQLQPRPRFARLAQHPQARLDRRVGDALARLQGHEDGRPHGRQARDAGRADGARGRPEQNLLLVKGAVPGPKNGFVEVREDSESWPRLRHRCSTLARQGGEARHARGGRLRRRGEAAPRPRDGARRAERGAGGHARRQEPRARRRRPREAVAPEGHRPRTRRARSARRTGRAAASPSRRHARLRRQGEPQGAEGRAARRALRARAGRHARRARRLRLRRAVDEGGRRAARRVGQGAAGPRRRAATRRRRWSSRSATSSASS